MSTNFHLAPPPKTVDGLLAVPVDIQSIEAVFTFDGSAETASADATITYTVGPDAGNPIFDLRQEITQAWIDGVIFPVAQLAHHNFGAVPFTDLRVIEAVQAAGSVHTLRVQYDLALPNSQLGGSYLPILSWSAGPSLTFAFGLSDLNRARYAEAWLPANLIFDQYSIDLEISIINTMAAHSVITNAAVTALGANHWQLSFPERFSALSPLLEVRATSTLVEQTDTVVLPVSGKTVTIDALKLTSSSVNLTTQINNLKTFLEDNENDYGPYLHEERFVAFSNGTGGMEYEGGTTTSVDALLHETFHSWFARGIKPASQADGWFDEGFTVFHDQGADDPIPFDFTDPPIILCSRDPWQRNTAGNAYVDGSNFWKGMASLIGVTDLNSFMASLYDSQKGNPLSTEIIEEFLLANSGEPQVVDAFHRFVYGLADPSPAPDLWLRDDPAHAGDDEWDGVFWDSPDLWIRNSDDGGTSHESPEFGQDNWFHARVRNRSSSGSAQHFVVTFHAKGFAGTQFVYPGDLLPCIAAKAEFDLGPGDTRVVKARWPRASVPPAGTHTCMLASVITRSDHPVSSKHVWEHNNLAQKNLTVVDLLPNTFMILPVVVINWFHELDPRFELELWKSKRATDIDVSLIHRSKDFFRLAKAKVTPFKPSFTDLRIPPDSRRLECGNYLDSTDKIETNRIITSNTPELIARRFPQSWEAVFPDRKPAFRAEIPPFTQKVVGVKVAVRPGAKTDYSTRIHFVQRHSKTRRIVGGVALQVNVKGASSHRREGDSYG